MSKNMRWKAYNTKHPEKIKVVEITRVSNKFSHVKKVVQREKKAKEKK